MVSELIVDQSACTCKERSVVLGLPSIAPDKDWKQLGIYLPLFGLIGYFKLGISSFCFGYPEHSDTQNYEYWNANFFPGTHGFHKA